MIKSGHILVINPGSTSTKLALYKFGIKSASLTVTHEIKLDHSKGELESGEPLLDQLELRLRAVEEFLNSTDIKPDLIMARGGPLRPIAGGVYEVDQYMVDDLQSARYGDHASSLAALIGERIAAELNIRCYIADSVTTDEFEPLARISGVPGIERKSRSHALNIKASARKLCKQIEKDYQNSNWVICHMGGGISIAALRDGRIIDVNDALLGMGPFSHDRAGALPLSGVLELAYSEKYSRSELELILSKKSGLKAYLDTKDFKEVEGKFAAGDEQAELIVGAMVYQIAKEISAMASVFAFQIDGILLTGGMAHSKMLCDAIMERVNALSPIYIEAGENELEALAAAGLRISHGEEPIKTYGPGKTLELRK